ncbi:hypothetical protein C8024_04160 [Sphingopyxis sp. BSNA05]|nr:hypothetical protein [Sphingopyxis sp. BSNA05]
MPIACIYICQIRKSRGSSAAMSNEMISSISYISTARAGLTDADFQAILEEASKRNETLGLTGLLTFNGLNFMQTLEGPRKASASASG